MGTSSPDPHFYAALIRFVLATADITSCVPAFTAPVSVEFTVRVTGDGKTLLFALNGRGEPAVISGVEGYTNLLADQDAEMLEATLTLGAWGVAILTQTEQTQ